MDYYSCLSSYPGVASTPWDNNFWLDLDFLDVARAAQRCSSYFTSLLYIEIWRGASERRDSIQDRPGSYSSVDEEEVRDVNILDEFSM